MTNNIFSTEDLEKEIIKKVLDIPYKRTLEVFKKDKRIWGNTEIKVEKAVKLTSLRLRKEVLEVIDKQIKHYRFIKDKDGVVVLELIKSRLFRQEKK